nr:hypothetical protein BaRGS_002328 [Batillaria attramentaria]
MSNANTARPVEKLFERAPQSLKDVVAMVGDNYAVISKTDDAGVRERELQRLLKKIDDSGNYGTCGAGRVIIHIRSRTREVGEARLCGNSLPIGPIAHPLWVGADLEKIRNEELWERAGQKPVAKQILRRKYGYCIPSGGCYGWTSLESNTVVDTPGLYDTSQDPGKTLKELTNVLSLSSPGPHAILFLTRRDQKFTKEDNTHDELERKQEVEEILKKVDQASKNGTRYYRNDDLKKMMKLINDEIEKVKEEKNIEWYRYSTHTHTHTHT